MDAGAVVAVSAAVVALTSLTKWAGIRDTLGPWVILINSLLGVGLWAYSKGPDYAPSLLFDYFEGWIAIAMAAAGVFGFTRSLPAAVVTGNPRSSIPGAGQNPTIKPDSILQERRDR